MTNNIIKSMRPEQWSKNLIIFAGIFFGGIVFDKDVLLKTFCVFMVFCLLSGALYILNDIVDIDRDRHIKEKSERPIASGKLSVTIALTASIAFFILCLVVSCFLSLKVFIVAVIFICTHLIYDFILKHIVLLDVFTISFSFLLRLFAGLFVLPIKVNEISSWILLCTVFLSLFLALCKRRSELIILEENAKYHRKSLEGYNEKYLDTLISITAGASIVSYSLYTLSLETIAKHGTSNIKYTIPFVLFGIVRYLYLVYVTGKGMQPEKLLYKDAQFLVNILAYIVISYLILYVL